MSDSEAPRDEAMEKLLLDIKALALLHGSDAELRASVTAAVVDSPDESMRRFVGALQSGKKPAAGRLFAMALGEMVLASLLVLAGTVTLIPTVVGIKTPQDLVDYFAQKFYGAIGASPLSQYVSVIEFALGVVLVLSAFYTLRQAAQDLNELGLSIRTGET